VEPVVSARSPLSRTVRRLDQMLAHSAATGMIAIVVVAFVVALAIAGFPESWEVAFSTAASAVTLVMVFALHHSQRREQAATQLKLDELIRALPQADDRYVHVQASHDDELREMEQEHIEHHQATRAGTSS
jgi:low affinity Fe/Cu permease